MAEKRHSVDPVLARLVGDSLFSDEEQDGCSAPDSFSSSSEELYLDGKDGHEDMSEDEDEDPAVSDGQSQLAPPSSTSSQLKAKQSTSRGGHQGYASSHTTAAAFMSRAAQHPNGWQTEEQADTLPEPLPLFCPARTPGVQGFGITDNPSPCDLFKAFFDKKTVNIICDNTNKQAKKNIEQGKIFKWSDIGPDDFFKFVGLLFYMAVLKVSWVDDSVFSLMSPALIMTRYTFQAISMNLHMSDPEKDVQNDRKKGTPNYDPLHRLKPLHDHIKNACKAFYHPRQNIAVDERMVATKAKLGAQQFTRNKLTKNGIKLFMLLDSSNGYTIAFTVYTGRSHFSTGQGLSFDSVMTLVDDSFLGSGYHLYCDDFYTTPKLFKELLSLKVRACGTYRDKRKETPTTKVNAITRKSSRGTIRWIRDGPLLFTKWMDRREVSICSSIHTAYTGETVERRVKRPDGQWQTQRVPVPTPVKEHNKHMSGVDLSNQLVQSYSVLHRTRRWYQNIFHNFLDIAATNAYIIHKELCQRKRQQPMTHLKFIESLAAELCGFLETAPLSRPTTPDAPSSPATPSEYAPSSSPASSRAPTPEPQVPVLQSCLPEPINRNPQQSTKATEGRLQCVHCKKKTAWRCRNCGKALCLIVDRNCFANWHDELQCRL